MSNKPSIFSQDRVYPIRPVFSGIACALHVKEQMKKLRKGLSKAFGVDPGILLDQERTFTAIETKQKILNGGR